MPAPRPAAPIPAPPRAPGSEVARRLETALAAARSAGERTLHYFNTTRFQTETKADGSPVTTADREAEHALRRAIASAFPDDGILGEELGEAVGHSGYRWVIDPIDGTKAFVHGVPLYGVLVAVERDLQSLAGVIHMPALAETVYASQGGGAWHAIGPRSAEPRPAGVSGISSLAEALVCITAFEYFAKARREELLLALGRRARSVRGWSDCYAHLLVATGRADAVVDPVMNPWDGAASTIILAEAGGLYTDLQGRPTAHTGSALISNGRLHPELLALVAQTNRPS